jgi:hypothetical protein
MPQMMREWPYRALLVAGGLILAVPAAMARNI